MPELPEVEVVRRGLLEHVVGRSIEHATVIDPRSVRRHAPGAAHFASGLAGRRILEVARRGKFLWVTFEPSGGAVAAGDDALVIHLGMSGQLRVRHEDAVVARQASAEHSGPASDPTRHRRIALQLAGGARLDFLDQRLFGGMHLSPLHPTHDAEPGGAGTALPLVPEAARHVARDLLDPALDEAALVTNVRRRSAPIKSLLLHQEMVSGIGNIYADEGLHAARIHYRTPARVLPADACHALLDATRTTMRRALEVGGTSFDALYVNVEGRSGYFARSLAAYGREGQPCPRCGESIVREKFANRSSFLCPACQREP